MKYALAIVLTVLLSVTASAQQFVPYVVTEQDHNALIAWLNEQPIPPKYANPIMNRLNVLEQMAVSQKDAARAAQEKRQEPEK